jgi:hypothetical protein
MANIQTKPLSFEVSCSGLKPKTKHDFYYKNKKMINECKSLMPGPDISSTTLVSDEKGNLKFRFQMEVKYTIKRKSFLIFFNRRKYLTLEEPPGDALFEVRAQNSSAKSLVQFKDF